MITKVKEEKGKKGRSFKYSGEKGKSGFSVQLICHHCMLTKASVTVAFLPRGNVLVLTSVDLNGTGEGFSQAYYIMATLQSCYMF